MMVGGDATRPSAHRPVLDAMTAKLFHMGPAGAGAAMKLVVQAGPRPAQRGGRRGDRARRGRRDRAAMPRTTCSRAVSSARRSSSTSATRSSGRTRPRRVHGRPDAQGPRAGARSPRTRASRSRARAAAEVLDQAIERGLRTPTWRASPTRPRLQPLLSRLRPSRRLPPPTCPGRLASAAGRAPSAVRPRGSQPPRRAAS